MEFCLEDHELRGVGGWGQGAEVEGLNFRFAVLPLAVLLEAVLLGLGLRLRVALLT